MSNVKLLEERLKEEVERFRNEGVTTCAHLEQTRPTEITWEDIAEVYRQTFYVLDKFQEHITEHLKKL